MMIESHSFLAHHQIRKLDVGVADSEVLIEVTEEWTIIQQDNIYALFCW